MLRIRREVRVSLASRSVWPNGPEAERVRGLPLFHRIVQLAPSVALAVVMGVSAAAAVPFGRSSEISGRLVFASLPAGDMLFETRDVASFATITIPQLLAMSQDEHRQCSTDLEELGTVIGVALKCVERISGSIGKARRPGSDRDVALVVEGGFDWNAVSALVKREGATSGRTR